MALGHNIVADGWAGANNPHSHPPPPNTHTHTQRHPIPSCSIINAHFCTFNSRETHGPMDGLTDGPTDGPMDQLMDKASYRVACPQLIRPALKWAQIGHYSETLFPSIFHVPFA